MSEEYRIDLERMSDAMMKYHLRGFDQPLVIHEFSDVDRGDPHDHPFPFRSIILKGSYVEEVYGNNGFLYELKHCEGDSFEIDAKHVHRIVELPDGQCRTLIIPGEWEQTPGFWQFRDDGPYRRDWNGDWVKQ